ncbi:MAG TPA: ABC transporter permease [Blastocatellia bacterium]|nr:ABC transporter permease [Blastocatellia bacterium]
MNPVLKRFPAERLSEPDRKPGDQPFHLPEYPLVVIEPGRGWAALNLRDLWDYREVFYFLMWRDVKVRYKQTFFGIAWAVIQPLFLMIVFTFFFGKLVRVPSDGIPYPVFIYAAVVPWTFFSNALANAGNSLIGNSNLITKVYFPRLLIPAAAVGAGLVDFAIALVLFAGLMPYYDLALTWSLLMLLPLIAITTLLALAVGIWTAALNARYRDVRHALPFVIQLWMFATPIIYPLSLVPEDLQWLISINPLTGIIEGYRSALFGRPFDWQSLSFAAAITAVLLLLFTYLFRRMEDDLADVI